MSLRGTGSGNVHYKVSELHLPFGTRVLEHLAVHQPRAPGAPHVELHLQQYTAASRNKIMALRDGAHREGQGT